jgi:hypothetical protein
LPVSCIEHANFKKFTVETYLFIFLIPDVKPCRLGSIIQNMEAEWRLRVITDESGESLVSRTGAVG